MYKIIGADQNEYGPITAEQVRQWMAEGRLNGLSKIQVDGSGVWKQMRDVPEFSAHLPPRSMNCLRGGRVINFEVKGISFSKVCMNNS